MKDTEIIERMRIASANHTPTEIVGILDDCLTSGITDVNFIFYFKRAFPGIPIPILVRFCLSKSVVGIEGDFEIEEFNESLVEWISASPIRNRVYSRYFFDDDE